VCGTWGHRGRVFSVLVIHTQEVARQQGAGHLDGRQLVARPAQLCCGGGPGPGVPGLRLFQLVEHFIQPQALDELHDVIGQAVLLADAEDRHDVGVVQPGRRFRLAFKALLGAGVEQQVPGQDLEGDVSAQGDLLGLVDDAHAALADFAEDAKVAELLQGKGRRHGLWPRGLLVVVLDLLDLDQGGEQFADVGGELRIALDIFAQGRALAAPVACGQLIGEPGEQDEALGTGVGHVRPLPGHRSAAAAGYSLGSSQMLTVSSSLATAR
jgi:hypothetical protein